MFNLVKELCFYGAYHRNKWYSMMYLLCTCVCVYLLRYNVIPLFALCVCACCVYYVFHILTHMDNYTSYIIHHTSYIIHHTSYIIHHTSYIIHHTSYIIHHTSYTMHHTSYIIHHHTSYLIPDSIHITNNVSAHRNKLIHVIFVPLIWATVAVIFCYTGPLFSINLSQLSFVRSIAGTTVSQYVVFNGAFILMLFYGLYYITLDPIAGVQYYTFTQSFVCVSVCIHTLHTIVPDM